MPPSTANHGTGSEPGTRPLSPADLLAGAVRDNAQWCALFARTHGITGFTDADAWSSPVSTPPGYPDAVTLRPGVDGAILLARIDTAAPGCDVKDSYADLDLTAHGFRELFGATWIGRPGGAPHRPAAGRIVEPRDAPSTAAAGSPSFGRVTDPAALRAWAAGWGHDGPEPLFRPELLRAPEVTILAAWEGRDVVAGAILTRWEAPVVGVSNVFTTHGDLAGVWAGILGWADIHHAGLPLVGYEAGDELAAALDAGFSALGPLRVWIALDPA